MEAESEAVGMLVAGDGLENKFAQLESGTVEDELAALKKGMLGAGAGEMADRGSMSTASTAGTHSSQLHIMQLIISCSSAILTHCSTL